MFELRLDLTAFERQARQFGDALDQVPYGMSLALNRAATNTRQALVQDTWPGHVKQRNSGFIGRALRTQFATKHDLRIEIYDALGRAHLKLHDAGGTKRARGRLAIPPAGAVTRTSTGVRKNQRPRAIIASTPARALRITPKGIFIGKGGRLQLMYAFKTTAAQPADVPFTDDFRDTMTVELRTSFPAAMARAMRSRR
jgi:hypothetical protein